MWRVASVLLPEQLLTSGVIAPLPGLPAARLYAACEVMIQENVLAWTLPVGSTDAVDELAAVFADRAAIGVRGLPPIDRLPTLQRSGVSFVLLPVADTGLTHAGHDLGLPVLPGALTPQEIANASRLGSPAVHVTPVDTMGGTYPNFLRSELGELSLVVSGNVTDAEAERWFSHGATAVSPTVELVGNALSGGIVMGLRVRSRDYSSAAARGRSAAASR